MRFKSAGFLPFRDKPGTSFSVSNKILSPGRSILVSKSAGNDLPEE